MFTCGRDTKEDVSKRGSGGRTNIDIWDYRTAVDMTHHFARHHRDIGVQIEQPMSKAIINGLTKAFNTTRFSRLLMNQNCVVIGSPDVSDFAEVTLAELLGVDPYTPYTDLRSTRLKLIKSGECHSTFYSSSDQDGGVEGVRVLTDDDSDGVLNYRRNNGPRAAEATEVGDNRAIDPVPGSIRFRRAFRLPT